MIINGTEKKGKNILAAAYNGVRTVPKSFSCCPAILVNLRWWNQIISAWFKFMILGLEVEHDWITKDLDLHLHPAMSIPRVRNLTKCKWTKFEYVAQWQLAGMVLLLSKGPFLYTGGPRLLWFLGPDENRTTWNSY